MSFPLSLTITQGEDWKDVYPTMHSLQETNNNLWITVKVKLSK